MNRLVYLFELDSTISNQKLVDIGQQAMYNEIVNNGNHIVLSMNQLTDSHVIEGIIKNEKTYEEFIKLVKYGAIRVSSYKTKDGTIVATASQYMQMATMKKDFIYTIFNNVLNNDNIKKMFLNALNYCNLLEIDSLIGIESDIEKKNNLIYIKRYIKLIIALSMGEFSVNPPKVSKAKEFMTFFNIIIDAIPKIKFTNLEIKENSLRAIDILMNIKKVLSNNNDVNLNNRSLWIKELEKSATINSIENQLSIKLINLCYNYTVEDSISSVSKHYDDNNFEKTFIMDLQSRIEKNTFLLDNILNSKIIPTIYQKKDWKRASRVSEYNKSDKIVTDIYENGFEEEHQKWIKQLFIQTSKSIGVALLYIVLFIMIELSIDWGHNLFVIKETNIKEYDGLLNVLDIIVFGIFGSFVSYYFKIPDILNSVKNIYFRFIDICIVSISDYTKYSHRLMEKNK